MKKIDIRPEVICCSLLLCALGTVMGIVIVLSCRALFHVCPPIEVATSAAEVSPAEIETSGATSEPLDEVATSGSRGCAHEARLGERLKIKLFDTAVNVGVKQASKFLQSALNRLGAESATSLEIDGKIGPKTLAALCGQDEDIVLMLYAEEQARFYENLAARRPEQVKFLKGWLGRAGWIPD